MMRASKAVSRFCFVLCAALLVPHLWWLYGVERAAYSRLYVLPATLLLLGFVQYFAMADPERRFLARHPRAKLALLVLFALALPLLAALILGSVPLLRATSRFAAARLRLDRLPRSWWSPGAQAAVAAALFLGLFPLLNYMTMLTGPFGVAGPATIAAHPLFGVNAQGLRGPLPSAMPDPARPRLLFLGDSTTFGFPYAADDAYPARVGELLRAQGLGPVEVLNAGIIGQSVVQLSARLDAYLAYDPDVIFLMVGFHHYSAIRDRERLAQAPVGWRGHALSLLQPPLLAALVAVSAKLSPLLAVLSSSAASDEPDPLPVFREKLDEVLRRLVATGSPVLVLEYPSHAVPESVRELVRDAAARAGATYVPLVHLFTSRDQYAARDNTHPDRDGHRRIAEAVAAAAAPLLRSRAR